MLIWALTLRSQPEVNLRGVCQIRVKMTIQRDWRRSGRIIRSRKKKAKRPEGFSSGVATVDQRVKRFPLVNSVSVEKDWRPTWNTMLACSTARLNKWPQSALCSTPCVDVSSTLHGDKVAPRGCKTSLFLSLCAYLIAFILPLLP